MRHTEGRIAHARGPHPAQSAPIFMGIRAVAICATTRARRRGSALAAAPPSAPGASFSAVSPEPVARVLSDLTTRTRAARTSSWGYTLHQPDHRPPPLARTPARGAAVLAMPWKPAPRTHERWFCLLKGIAEGTYNSKHAEAARLYHTTTTTTTTTHIHTHTPTEL